MITRRIWRKHSEDTIYVPRCSRCGYFKREFMQHWFFTGLYCVACIQDVLYDNARTMKEIEK